MSSRHANRRDIAKIFHKSIDDITAADLSALREAADPCCPTLAALASAYADSDADGLQSKTSRPPGWYQGVLLRESRLYGISVSGLTDEAKRDQHVCKLLRYLNEHRRDRPDGFPHKNFYFVDQACAVRVQELVGLAGLLHG